MSIQVPRVSQIETPWNQLKRAGTAVSQQLILKEDFMVIICLSISIYHSDYSYCCANVFCRIFRKTIFIAFHHSNWGTLPCERVIEEMLYYSATWGMYIFWRFIYLEIVAQLCRNHCLSSTQLDKLGQSNLLCPD